MKFKVQPSAVHGNGCFYIGSTTLIIGTEITVPVIPVPKGLYSGLPHMFPWDKDNRCIVLHPFTACNASVYPNLKIIAIDRVLLTKTFAVVDRPIHPGDEILLKYSV